MDEAKKEFEEGKVPEGASRLPWVALLIIVVVGLGIFWWMKGAGAASINLSSNKYQVVFVSNGQTYYGKLHAFESNYPYLTEVYYLALQPQQEFNQGFDEGGNPLPTPTPAPQNFTVYSLVQDLHGPEDKIVFNKSSILFVEELRDDSQVLQAINNIKAQLGK